MSKKYPIIAITGSSGSGQYRLGRVFDHLAWRIGFRYLVIDGDGFHRLERDEMHEAMEIARSEGGYLSHFGPEGNRLDLLEDCLRSFSESGTGRHRNYLHTVEEATETGLAVGAFTPWSDIPEGTELLVYQGLHGAYVGPEANIAQYADMKLGVVPIVNLEWIQKICNDTRYRGYTREAVKDSILHRLGDYVRHITPQFSRTHINFQRIPMSDTSNPFEEQDMPTIDDSRFVVHFRYPAEQDFPFLLGAIDGSFMSRRDTIVIPGGEMEYAMELLLEPVVRRMIEQRRQA